MREKEKRVVTYYKIRRNVFWIFFGVVFLSMLIVYHKDKIYEKWKHSQGREDISYMGMVSKLEKAEVCYLCGISSKSLVGYYRKCGTIGVISLNDWYVVDFGLENYNEEGSYITEGNSGTSSRLTNTGDVTIQTSGTPSRGMASVDVMLPEGYVLDTKLIQEHLCQICLDKVTASLETSKWKVEKKTSIPLCLVDFQTLEIYSLQDWHIGTSIRDYWVEMEHGENEVGVKAFELREK